MSLISTSFSANIPVSQVSLKLPTIMKNHLAHVNSVKRELRLKISPALFYCLQVSLKLKLKCQLTAAVIPEKKQQKQQKQENVARDRGIWRTTTKLGPRPSRQQERKPLRENADRGMCWLHRALQPKDSRAHCLPECAVQALAYIITRALENLSLKMSISLILECEESANILIGKFNSPPLQH